MEKKTKTQEAHTGMPNLEKEASSDAKRQVYLVTLPHPKKDESQDDRTEQNRKEQHRTEQNRTEQNSTEQNKTAQNRTEQKRTA